MRRRRFGAMRLPSSGGHEAVMSIDQGRATLFEDLEIEGLKLVTPRKFGDQRGFFSETLQRRDLGEGRASLPVRAGQSLAVARGRHGPRPAFPDRAFRPGQARARDPGPHPRRRRRSAPLLADLRAPCGGRVVAGELAPAVHSGRLRPWLRDARTRHRGALQGHAISIRRA